LNKIKKLVDFALKYNLLQESNLDDKLVLKKSARTEGT
jgi:hypothetical protein